MTGAEFRLSARRGMLREALAESDAAPLSVRKAMLVVMLADAIVDGLARGEDSDPLAARTSLAARSPELALVLAIAAHRADGPRLVVEPVEVPLADFAELSTADFMVSLYNEHTVQRLLVALPDGSPHDAHDVLHRAVQAVLEASTGSTDPSEG